MKCFQQNWNIVWGCSRLDCGLPAWSSHQSYTSHTQLNNCNQAPVRQRQWVTTRQTSWWRGLRREWREDSRSLEAQPSTRMLWSCTQRQATPTKSARNVWIIFLHVLFFAVVHVNIQGEKAGEAFVKAAECHLKLQSKHEAAQSYINASLCYKKTNTTITSMHPSQSYLHFMILFNALGEWGMERMVWFFRIVILTLNIILQHPKLLLLLLCICIIILIIKNYIEINFFYIFFFVPKNSEKIKNFDSARTNLNLMENI